MKICHLSTTATFPDHSRFEHALTDIFVIKSIEIQMRSWRIKTRIAAERITDERLLSAPARRIWDVTGWHV